MDYNQNSLISDKRVRASLRLALTNPALKKRSARLPSEYYFLFFKYLSMSRKNPLETACTVPPNERGTIGYNDTQSDYLSKGSKVTQPDDNHHNFVNKMFIWFQA